MALKTGDRVKETTTVEGTGTATLLGAAVGFQTFSSVLSDGDTCYYCIELGSDFEVGTGTYSAGTLARTSVQSSSNANALVDFGAGTKSVFITFPAQAAQNLPVQPLTGILYVDQNSQAVSPDGSIAAPFLTISAALSAIGNATSEAEQQEGWRIIVAAGYYDENLSLPDLRNITIDCEPLTYLTDPTFTSERLVVMTQTRASLSANRQIDFKIKNLYITANVRISQYIDGNTDCDFTFEGCVFADPNAFTPSIDCDRWETDQLRLNLIDCEFIGSNPQNVTTAVGQDVAIASAVRTNFNAEIYAQGYGLFSVCTFAADLTFDAPAGATSMAALKRPIGFYNCKFENPVQFNSTQAGDFKVDDVTWASAQTNVTVNAPATVENLSDAFYDADPANWAAPAPDSISSAIDRLAAFVAATHGAIP